MGTVWGLNKVMSPGPFERASSSVFDPGGRRSPLAVVSCRALRSLASDPRRGEVQELTGDLDLLQVAAYALTGPRDVISPTRYRREVTPTYRVLHGRMPRAVATCGTAWPKSLQDMRNFAKRIVARLRRDKAGQSAAASLPSGNVTEVDVFRCASPKGQDPAELAQHDRTLRKVRRDASPFCEDLTAFSRGAKLATAEVRGRAANTPEVLASHRVSWCRSYIMQVAARCLKSHYSTAVAELARNPKSRNTRMNHRRSRGQPRSARLPMPVPVRSLDSALHFPNEGRIDSSPRTSSTTAA